MRFLCQTEDLDQSEYWPHHSSVRLQSVMRFSLFHPLVTLLPLLITPCYVCPRGKRSKMSEHIAFSVE